MCNECDPIQTLTPSFQTTTSSLQTLTSSPQRDISFIKHVTA